MKHRIALTKFLCASLLALFSVVASAGSTSITYYHNDVTGSPVAATNQAGQVVWRKTYAPFGETSGKDRDNKVGYTGHTEDGNGLVYAGARYYDPALGRFLGVDSKGFSEKDPMSFNRYAYADNNPYKYVDPDGRKIVPSVSAKNIQKYETAKSALLKSEFARNLWEKLDKSEVVYAVTDRHAEGTNDANYNKRTHEITIDFDINQDAYTSDGIQKIPLEIVLGHEVGHAATGIEDNDDENTPGIDKMRNVNANENPIRHDLHMPDRIKYEAPPKKSK